MTATERQRILAERKAARESGLMVSGSQNLPASSATPAPADSASSPYVVMTGSVISASLITGLRSDLPGLVTAQVSERVYDSPTGRILLIPQGARLVGSW